MANQKIDTLTLGKGQMNSTTSSAQIFASTSPVSFWNASVSYNVEACVEHSGKIWRSLVNSNVGNVPASGAQWELILKNVKDGDACFVIAGAFSDLLIRANGLWQSLGAKPYIVALNDNQAVPASAFTYNGSAFPYAQIELRVRRNNSYSSAFKRTYEVLNDGTSEIQFSSDGVSIGADTGVVFSPSITTGVVSFNYTSTNLGQAITLEYTIKGF